MLPQINPNPLTKDMDTNKQFAALRNQISQLRDDVDQALMSIGYDNLTLELRKKIDKLETEITGNTNLSNMVAESVKSKYVRTEVLEADMAIVMGDISSINGSISTINGNIFSINGDISTINGNIYSINGDIGTINGNITTLNGAVSANSAVIGGLGNGTTTINGACIKTGTISANRISADLLRTAELSSGALASVTIQAKGISCSSDVDGQGGRFDYLNVSGKSLSLDTISIGGVPRQIVTWS